MGIEIGFDLFAIKIKNYIFTYIIYVLFSPLLFLLNYMVLDYNLNRI
jgi:hypothetical protein